MFRPTLRCFRAPPSGPRPPTKFNPSWKPQHKGRPPGPTDRALITPHMRHEYNPSQKVLKFATELKITFPSAVQMVPGQKLDDFPMRFYLSSHHAFSYYHVKFLTAIEHPLTDKILHFYAQEKLHKPLWCYVQCTPTDNSNAVLRQSSERAVRAALFKALNAAGYDSNGKSLDGTGRSIQGTLRINITEPKGMMKVEFQRLVDYLTKIVSNNIPRLRGSPKPQ
jgi:hypothetical protein